MLTWDQLNSRGIQGPSYCFLCKKGGETTQHLFMDCLITKRTFEVIFEHFGIHSFYKDSVRLYLEHWFQSHPLEDTKIYLPLFVFWSIWKHRNGCIFEGNLPSVYVVFIQIDSLYHLFPMPKKRVKLRNIGLPPPITYPCGYFDGAVAGNIGGAGFVLHLSISHCLYFSLGCGSSTNTRSELLALWALLSVSKIMGIPLDSIFGDSLVWATGNDSMSLAHLSHWCDDIRDMFLIFPEVTMKHIYREHNQIADNLSKKALSLESGFGNFMESLNDMIIEHGNFQLY